MLLLLLLSHFSHVQLCAIPETAAYQAPLSMELSRQEYWSGLPFPSPSLGKENGNTLQNSCLENPNPWGHKTAKQNLATKQEQEQKYHINVK